MHCPNCGTKASAGQKFCRACGFSLENVARLIAEQAPGEYLDSDSGPKEEPSKSSRKVWILFFIIIMFLIPSVHLNATGKATVFLPIVLIIVLFVFLLCMPASINYIESGRKRPGGQKSPRPASSTNAPTTKKLPPQPDPEMNASVTEQTTANLAEKVERGAADYQRSGDLGAARFNTAAPRTRR